MAATPPPPCRFKAAYHWPKYYRYRATIPGWRGMRNRYSGQRGSATIGAAMVVGRYAYCVKWADSRVST